MPLDRAKYGVAISWDKARKDVDLDLQVVLVDSQGRMADAIYHNNLSALNGAVTHSGDSKTGSGTTYGELVWIDNTKLPLRIKMLIFIVCAASGGHLIDVRKGMISVLMETTHGKSVLARYPLECSVADVDAVVMMKRSVADGSWAIGPIDEAAEEGVNFMDITDVLLKLIRTEIPQLTLKSWLESIATCGYVMEKEETNYVIRHRRGPRRCGVVSAMRRSVCLGRSKLLFTFQYGKKNFPDHEVDFVAVAFGHDGDIIQVVNSSNVYALAGAMTVSCRALRQLASQEGPGEIGRDEISVAVDFDKMTKHANFILFLVNVDEKPGLKALDDWSALIVDATTSHTKARFRGCCDPLVNSPGCWRVLFSARYTEGADLWELVESVETLDEPTLFASRHVCGALFGGSSPIEDSESDGNFCGNFNIIMERSNVVEITKQMCPLSISVSWQSSGNRSLKLSTKLLFFDGFSNVLDCQEYFWNGGDLRQVNSLNDIPGYAHKIELDLADQPEAVDQIVVLVAVESRVSMEASLSEICFTVSDQRNACIATYKDGKLNSYKSFALARFVKNKDSLHRPWMLQAVGAPTRPSSLWKLTQISTLEWQAGGDEMCFLTDEEDLRNSDRESDCDEERRPHVPLSLPPFLFLDSAAENVNLRSGRSQRKASIMADTTATRRSVRNRLSRQVRNTMAGPDYNVCRQSAAGSFNGFDSADGFFNPKLHGLPGSSRKSCEPMTKSVDACT